MYRVDKLFEFFEICNLEHQNVEFLFITNDLKELSLQKINILVNLACLNLNLFPPTEKMYQNIYL